MELSTIIFLILGFAALMDFFIIFLIVKRNFHPLLNKALVFQMFGILGWTIAIAANIYLESLFVEMWIFAFAAFSLTAQWFFVVIFPSLEYTMKNKLLLIIGGFIGLFFTGISFLPGAVFSNITVTEKGYTIVDPGPLSGMYALFVFVFIIASIIVLWRRRKSAQNSTITQQAKYLLYGYITFFIINLLTNSLLPVVFNIFFFNSIGPVFSVALVIFIAYIITKHQFLEIRIFIQRGLIYTILLSFIIILYSAVLTLSNNLFPNGGATERFFSSIFTILIAVLSVPRIDTYLRKKTDPIFFKGTYDYTEALHTLSRAMHNSLQMDTLLTTAEANLKEILRASSVHIVKDKTTQEDGELHIPIKLQDKLVGIIVLGEKLSGEAYSEQDRQLLKTFARQAAIAIGRILLYKEVKKRAEELEEKVVERTQELKDSQEKQRITMLQISHNLQTPLTILQTKIEDVKKIKGMEKTAEGLTRSLQNLSFFISDLLRYARLDTQQETFEITHCNVSTALYELSEELTVIAEPNGITITNNITDNIFIQADCKKIREVFMNIASNALKYMGDTGRRELSISVTKENDNAVCTISDTGIGIAPEHLPHIFDQFYRVKGTHAEGTGLGLAISKKIIEKHNGSITVTSTVGSGTTFTVTLPIATSK